MVFRVLFVALAFLNVVYSNSSTIFDENEAHLQMQVAVAIAAPSMDSVGLPTPHTINELSDLIAANVLGLPPMSEHARKNMIAISSYKKPLSRSNMLMMIRGAEATQAEMLGMRQKFQPLTIDQERTHNIDIDASLATGKKHNQHEIGEYDAKDDQKSDSKCASQSRSASIADILNQEFNGKALTVSFAKSARVACAFGVHSVLKQRLPNVNDVRIYFNREAQSFVAEEYPELTRSIDDLIASLESDDSILKGSISGSVADNVISINGTEFDLGKSCIRESFAELQYLHDLIRSFSKNSQLDAALNDDIPDSFVIDIDVPRQISREFGSDSLQYVAVMHVLKNIQSHIQTQLKSAVFEVVLLRDALPLESTANSQIFEQSSDQYSNSYKQTDSVLADNAVLFDADSINIVPDAELLIKNEHSPSSKRSDGHLHRHSLEDVQKYIGAQDSPSAIGLDLPYVDNNPYVQSVVPIIGPTYNSVERYQIALWLSIVLVITLFVAISSLAFQDNKKDTLLYSTFPAVTGSH